MPRPGIPPALEPAVLAEAGKGRSHRDIAAWLKATHGVGVTHVTVGKLLKRVRGELSETTRAVAVNELAPQVVGDIAELEAMRRRARAIEEKAMEGRIVTALGEPLVDKKTKKPMREPDLELALKAIKEQAAILDKKLHYAGADGSSDKVDTLADLMAAALKS